MLIQSILYNRYEDYKKHNVEFCISYNLVIKKNGQGNLSRFDTSIFRKIRDMVFVLSNRDNLVYCWICYRSHYSKMTDEDIQEYHNIGKAIKHNNKYTYVTGTQITDQETGTRVYDVSRTHAS